MLGPSLELAVVNRWTLADMICRWHVHRTAMLQMKARPSTPGTAELARSGGAFASHCTYSVATISTSAASGHSPRSLTFGFSVCHHVASRAKENNR